MGFFGLEDAATSRFDLPTEYMAVVTVACRGQSHGLPWECVDAAGIASGFNGGFFTTPGRPVCEWHESPVKFVF